jgi:6-phosphogluconolactonase (cycloisomerase 2 family)
MKFRKFGQATLAAVVSLGMAAGITACSTGVENTVDYVYVTNSKNNPGQIDVYYADSQSGALTPIPSSPYPSGGRNPVALAKLVTTKFSCLYVVNHDDNTIVQFTIGSDAKLYPQHTYNTPGTFPNAVSINAAGTLLFVTDTYQPQYTAANPGPGAVVVYPISQTDGSLGSPVANGDLPYYPLSTGETNVLNPVAVNVLTSNPSNATTATGLPTYLYVVNVNNSNPATNPLGGLGSISAFSVDSSGALTPVPGPEADGTFAAGTTPSAVASTPLGLFLYVTDSANNQLISYTVQSSGAILPSQVGPTRTDVFPDSVIVDPRGQYVYVANYTAGDISAYTINPGTGYPTGVAAAGTYATGTGPTCVFIEPALARYVYTTNFLDNTISGFNLNPNTGTLATVQNNPFPAAGQPTCVTATPHGNHGTTTPIT